MNNELNCRFCGGLLAELVDLGMSPLCESYLAKEQLNSIEPFYPLAAYVCRDCLLVQLQEYVAPEHIFSEYAYFWAYSDSWLDHVRRYVEAMTERLGLGPASRVIELGSNDGYLLQFFVDTVDRNPYKQGKYLSGTRIPIFPPEKIAETKPDYVLILPWNLKDEITAQLAYIRNWGAKFVVPIPEVSVI